MCAKLALVQLANGLIQASAADRGPGGDARFHDAAVVLLTLARDQGAFFHAVEEARHVRDRERSCGRRCCCRRGLPVPRRAGCAGRCIARRSGRWPSRSCSACWPRASAVFCRAINAWASSGRAARVAWGRELIATRIVVITMIVKRKKSAPPYAFRSGRSWTSLRKLCGPCVTTMATACATSSGVSTFEGSLGPRPENSVATLPGQMTLTRIPCSRKIFGHARGQALHAPLRRAVEAAAGERVASRQRADVDDVSAPWRIIEGATALETRKTLFRLVLRTRSQSASDFSCAGPKTPMPALLTRMEIGPERRLGLLRPGRSRRRTGDVGEVRKRAR